MLGKVEICGVNTAKLKVLGSDECRELLIKAKQGDAAARAVSYTHLTLPTKA